MHIIHAHTAHTHSDSPTNEHQTFTHCVRLFFFPTNSIKSNRFVHFTVPLFINEKSIRNTQRVNWLPWISISTYNRKQSVGSLGLLAFVELIQVGSVSAQLQVFRIFLCACECEAGHETRKIVLRRCLCCRISHFNYIDSHVFVRFCFRYTFKRHHFIKFQFVFLSTATERVGISKMNTKDKINFCHLRAHQTMIHLLIWRKKYATIYSAVTKWH